MNRTEQHVLAMQSTQRFEDAVTDGRTLAEHGDDFELLRMYLSQLANVAQAMQGVAQAVNDRLAQMELAAAK